MKAYERMSAVQLVKQAQRGDEQAFAQLYQRYAPSIYYYGLQLSHNEADAKDIVQDTFIQAHHSLCDLKDPKLFKVWLNRIAFTKAAKLFSKNRTISFDPDDAKVCESVIESRRECIPHAQMHFQSDKELLDHFIAQLPFEQRSALLLMYYESFSLQEIAQIMETPIGTVKSRIHSAKTKLNEMIDLYEDRNQIKLSFHGDTLAASLGVLGGKELLKGSVINWYHGITKLCSISNVAIAAVSVSCAVVLVAGGMHAENVWNGGEEETSFIAAKDERDLRPFPPVIYQQITYQRADDAYYALIRFAHCQIDMDQRSDAELREIHPLYEGLKAYGSIYYERLVEEQWVSAYEARLSAIRQ